MFQGTNGLENRCSSIHCVTRVLRMYRVARRPPGGRAKIVRNPHAPPACRPDIVQNCQDAVRSPGIKCGYADVATGKMRRNMRISSFYPHMTTPFSLQGDRPILSENLCTIYTRI